MADDNKSTGEQGDKLAQYLTRRRGEVVSNLLELSRTVEPLTIMFDSGKHSFPTSIIDLVSDNNTVVFERANSDGLNKKLLSQKTGTVVGQPDGIKVRFILESIEAAEHNGDKVFVAPVPREHYRMQRRRLFRIDTQISNPVKVTLTLPTGEEVTLNAGNISSGGLRLDDVDHVLECELRQVLTGCTIQIPDMDSFPADLQVRNSYEKAKKNGNLVHFVGCMFENLPASHESDIQNYINTLQRAQRAMAK